MTTLGLETDGRVLFAEGAPDACLDGERTENLLDAFVESLGQPKRVLLVPPDATRSSSGAGLLTVGLFERLSELAEVELLPATGTHAPMTVDEIRGMFPGIPPERFHHHDWRRDVVRLGEIPAEFVESISEGRVRFPIEVALARRLLEGRWDAIVSIGQLVPHEVAGIANGSKNVFVGVGGFDMINKSHFLGAVYGMERIMGRAETPVRQVFEFAEREFVSHLPIRYLLRVGGTDAEGRAVTRGLYAGQGPAPFREGSDLCRRVNLVFLDRPVKKMIVRIDDYKSTWLGNKAIYRTRMAIADGGELVVLAPAVREFGEDPGVDALIRRHGYRGTEDVLARVKKDPELAGSLSAAAHLIHGSSEGRFRVVYATRLLRREEVESVGFEFMDYDAAIRQYDPERLREGWNTLPGGEEVYYVSHPGQGLWIHEENS